MLGAAALCALASMRSGAGLVTVGTAKSLNLTLQRKISPAIMTWPLPQTSNQTIAFKAAAQILKKIERFNVIALGPGLGQDSGTQRFILELIHRSNKPLVIDADALNALAHRVEILKKSKVTKILTPHPGEMARLTGLSKDEIQKNRKKVAQDFSKRFECVLVLKGQQTVVASPDGKVYVNTTGNSGMGKAGTGDILTGIVAAFLAQGIEPFEAAKSAVYIHGKAGDQALKFRARVSLLATDIIDSLPVALKNALP